MSAHVIDKSVCFNYMTRVYSVQRDVQTTATTKSRKTKLVQTIHEPSHLKYLQALKAEAFRACRSAGTKLEALSLWLVPEDHAPELEQKLGAILQKWDDFTNNTLYPNYLSWVEEYSKANPSEALEIIRLAPSLAEIQNSTRFVFSSLKLKYEEIKSVNLDKEILSLPEQAIHEIASELKDAGLAKPTQFTQSTRRVLERLSRKARVFQDMHPRLKELNETIENLLKNLPTAGLIKDNDGLAVRAVIDRILDSTRFMQEGFAVHSPTTVIEPAVKPVAVLPAPTDVKRILQESNNIRAAAARVLADQPSADDSPYADDLGSQSQSRRTEPAVTASGDDNQTDWSGW